MSGRIPPPNMESSVLTITCLAASCHVSGRMPNLGGEKIWTGRCTAAFNPVPKMSAKRVVWSKYALDSKVADESLTMAFN